MSLTSYRAAPPRGKGNCGLFCVIGRPGGDLLSHALRRSTIGAEGFHGRVRDGIGCVFLAKATRSSKLMNIRTRTIVRPRNSMLTDRDDGATESPLRAEPAGNRSSWRVLKIQADRAIS